MHCLSAQLHLQSASVAGIDSRMDALVAIGFWKRNVIFDLARYRTPVSMNDPERRITIGNTGEYHTQRKDVVDLVDVPPPSSQFEKKAVDTFDTRFGTEGADIHFSQLTFEILLDLFEALLVLFFALFQKLARFFVLLWEGVGQCSIFQILLRDRHTEPIGDRCVDLERLLCDTSTLLDSWHMLERPCIVKSIHELDDEHANVFCGRCKKFAQAFCVAFEPAVAQGPQLGHTFDEREDLGA